MHVIRYISCLIFSCCVGGSCEISLLACGCSLLCQQGAGPALANICEELRTRAARRTSEQACARAGRLSAPPLALDALEVPIALHVVLLDHRMAELILAPFVRRSLLDQATFMLGDWRFRACATDGRAFLVAAFRRWAEKSAQASAKKGKATDALMKLAASAFSEEGRMLGNALRKWKELLDYRRRILQNGAMRLRPEGQLMHAAMSRFRSRSPCWQSEGLLHVRISDDGFWAKSTRPRAPVHVFGRPKISTGVFRFGVRIHGSGSGAVVGVVDALHTTGPASERVSVAAAGGSSSHGSSKSARSRPIAWGVHVAHGALYTKYDGSDKGTLSTKALLPTPIDAARMSEPSLPGTPAATPGMPLGGRDVYYDLDCEVDMDTRRVAFGLPGGADADAAWRTHHFPPCPPPICCQCPPRHLPVPAARSDTPVL